MINDKIKDIYIYYEFLDELEKKVGGKRILGDCHGKMDWPNKGVNFFFEPGEERTTSGKGLRVVRVGTHALKKGSKTTLWNRLRQHKGGEDGSGNHRGSVFRKHIGEALGNRCGWEKKIMNNWGENNASSAIKKAEFSYECEISKYIRRMPFLWLEVEDEPGPKSKRAYIEKNTISLLSNFSRRKNPVDPPGLCWLGNCAKNKKISESGLWNVNHVDECFHGKEFLNMLEGLLK